MPDPVTANIGLAQPTRGSDTGVWDTPMNGNTTLLDLILGGTATIGLNNSNVVLSAAQFECEEIVFNSTLTGSVTITFPTSFTKSYVIQHICTGSSQFTITLATTVSGGQVIGCPPTELFEVRNDGTNLKFKNFGRIGEYWDHAGSSVPSWVPACTVPPYLNCDGTTFSSATYPALANYMGGNTLPDLRGRVRGYLNQGTGRINSSAAGGATSNPDGNTLLSVGGAQNTVLSSVHVPPVPITDPGHTHTTNVTQAITIPSQGGGSTFGTGTGLSGFQFPDINAVSNVTGISAGSTSPTATTNIPPMAMGGITMIRAG